VKKRKKRLKEKGGDCVRYYKYNFKVDLDMKIPLKWKKLYLYTRKIILRYFKFEDIKIVDRESEKGHHFFFVCKHHKKLTPVDCNMVQFLLGDDTSRVLINMRRIVKGIPWEVGNVLFDYVVWRRKHKCNCKIHQKFIKEQNEGQGELIKLDEELRKRMDYSL
jgi:hypothetical protein